MRRVFDFRDAEVQLRIVAPEGDIGKIEGVGYEDEPSPIRKKILLEYHNSKLGGHLGVGRASLQLGAFQRPGLATESASLPGL